MSKTPARSLMIGVLFAGLLGSADAKAPPIGYESYLDYYSDANHTNVVGGQHWTCDEELIIWGQHTAYSTYVVLPCS